MDASSTPAAAPIPGRQPLRARLLLLFLAVCLGAMLVVSLVERFRNPRLVEVVGQSMPPGMGAAPQSGAPAGPGDEIARLMQEAGRNPDNGEVIFHLAEALVAAGNWEAAETFARRAMVLDVSNPAPLHLLGVITHNLGREKEAADLLERALAMKEDAGVRYSLGVLYTYFLKDAERGRAHLQAALDLPDTPEEMRERIREELEKKTPEKGGDSGGAERKP